MPHTYSHITWQNIVFLRTVTDIFNRYQYPPLIKTHTIMYFRLHGSSRSTMAVWWRTPKHIRSVIKKTLSLYIVTL